MKNASDEGRSSRAVAVAALVFALVAPTTYLAQRLYERARVGVVDPSLILRSSHVEYLWRIAVASWWAGACALIGYSIARRRSGETVERVARAVAFAAAAAAVLVALAAWRFP